MEQKASSIFLWNLLTKLHPNSPCYEPQLADGGQIIYTNQIQNFTVENFKKIISFKSTEDRVYNALTNNISKWWTQLFEGVSHQQGQSFTIRFGERIFKTMMVEELIPNQKVTWKVTDALIDFPDLDNKTEWINTKIVWEIYSNGNLTEVALTHFGLSPSVKCFNICQDGWQNFVQSLSEYINTGIGKPFKKEPVN